MRIKILTLLFLSLTILAGIIWLFFDKPSIEPVTVILGGITGLLEGLDKGRVHRKLGIGIGILGLVLFSWGVSKAFRLWQPEESNSSKAIFSSNENINSQQEIYLDNAPTVIKQIGRMKTTEDLLKLLNTLVKRGDIAVGNYSDFEDDHQGVLYVVVVDDKNVLDIFRYKEFVFYDIDTNYSCRELRTKYKERKKIWVLHFAD